MANAIVSQRRNRPTEMAIKNVCHIHGHGIFNT